MTNRKAIAGYPRGLPTAAVSNLAQATTDTAFAWAGGNRWLYEMATGGPAPGEEVAGCLINPQGEPGVDASGPPFGTCVRHPVMVYGGFPATTDWDGVSRSAYALSAGGLDTLKMGEYIWVKPYPSQQDTPYSKLYFSVYASCASTETLSISMRTVGNGSNVEDTVSVNTGSATTYDFFEFSSPIPTDPGLNLVYLELSVTSSNAVNIAAMQWANKRKRSH